MPINPHSTHTPASVELHRMRCLACRSPWAANRRSSCPFCGSERTAAATDVLDQLNRKGRYWPFADTRR